MIHGVVSSQRPPGPCLGQLSCLHDLDFPCLNPFSNGELITSWGSMLSKVPLLVLTCMLPPLVASALQFWPRSINPTGQAHSSGLTALKPGSEMIQGTGHICLRIKRKLAHHFGFNYYLLKNIAVFSRAWTTKEDSSVRGPIYFLLPISGWEMWKNSWRRKITKTN